jgi:hypothetical protein
LQDSPDSTGLEFLLAIQSMLADAYPVAKEMPESGIFPSLTDLRAEVCLWVRNQSE